MENPFLLMDVMTNTVNYLNEHKQDKILDVFVLLSFIMVVLVKEYKQLLLIVMRLKSSFFQLKEQKEWNFGLVLYQN